MVSILLHQCRAHIGKKFLRLIIAVLVLVIISLICYHSYRGYVLNSLGREISVVESTDKLRGIVPPELIKPIHNQPKLCSGPPFRILICVKSTISNLKRRKNVRSTWASQYSRSEMDARIVFVVGKTKNPKLQEEMEAESSTYQDIIQGNFTDAYTNISIKSVFLLSWANKHCPNAEFLMSADDDTFLNPTNLLRVLKSHTGVKGVLMGIQFKDAKPYRQPKSKWYVSREEFKDEYYPPFLTGSAYIMSSDVLTKLHLCTITTPLFHLDDVYVTGICAKKAGIVSQFRKDFTQQTSFTYGCFLKDLVTSADLNDDDFIRVYREVLEKDYYSSTWCLFTRDNIYFTSFIILLLLTIIITTFVCLHKTGLLLHYFKPNLL